MITTLSSVAGVALSLLAASPPVPPPLDIHERTMVKTVVDDEAPAVLLNIRKKNYNEHYLAGNEEHMELFYEPLKDLGGVYAGVGTDQAYFFIGWMKAEYAFLTDYDPWVKRLHKLYAVVFEHAETPNAFRQLWSKEKRAQALELFAKAGLSKATINIYKWGRYLVFRRLHIQRKYFRTKHPEIPTFLTDQGTYDYVRAMVRQGRVRPMIGNLIANKGVKSVNTFCRIMNIELRAIYLSNAEQYWKRYPTAFRDNMRLTHTGPKSVVVRTVAFQPVNGGFRYIVQPFTQFKRFIDTSWVRRVSDVVPRIHLAMGQFKLERLDASPEEHRARVLAKRSSKRKKRRKK